MIEEKLNTDFQCLVYKQYDFEDAKISAFCFFGSPSIHSTLLIHLVFFRQ